MKKIVLTAAVAAAALFASPAAQAQGPSGKTFGLGIVLGGPTGLSGKYWLEQDRALAFSVGADAYRWYGTGLRLGADYLFHFNAFNSKLVKLYAGPGLMLGLGDDKKNNDSWLAARIPVGINIIPSRTPLEVFVEIAPVVGVLNASGARFDAAIGGRFYF
jgi:hypothetical protein